MSAEITDILKGKTAKELDAILAVKSGELHTTLEAKKLPNGTYDLSQSELEDFQSRDAELNDIGTKRDAVAAAERIAQSAKHMQERLHTEPANPMVFSNGGQQNASTHGTSSVTESKTLGQQFIESVDFKSEASKGVNAFSRNSAPVSVELKAPLTNAAGIPPAIARDVRLVPFAIRRPVVRDLIPQFQTTAPVIPYLRETVITNNAAVVGEGNLKPTSNFVFVRTMANVEVVGHLIPVTEQQLADVPQVRSIIDDRLIVMLKLAEEVQLLTGNGVPGQQLQGLYNVPNIQTNAKGAAPAPDAIYVGINNVRTIGFAEPSGIVMHPNNWMTIRLQQTSIGTYLWGDPSTAGPERIWGLPVIPTVAATLGTALLGDFATYSALAERMEIRVDAGYVNDDFARNQQTLRCEERVALLVYRAVAFNIVTGLL